MIQIDFNFLTMNLTDLSYTPFNVLCMPFGPDEGQHTGRTVSDVALQFCICQAFGYRWGSDF